MSHYKPYPAYKDSGVEWLGQVPEHWVIQKLKWFASLQSGDFITGESIEDTGTYPVYGGNGLRGYSDAFTHSGEYVLIGRQGALCGNINYASGDFWASEHAIVVSPYKKAATRWLGELLWSMNLNQYSVSAAQPGLAVERIIDLEIPVAPLKEQQVIAAHLDRETTRIDALITKKTRFIKLLREKRQALITHAVTKGLNPNVKMKDSGVEWLGEVPEHWDVKPIKWLSPVQRGASPRPIDDPKYFDDDGKYGWVRIEDVSSSGGYLIETKQKLSNLGASLSVKLPIGSLFLSIAGTVGKPCISLVDACIHDGFVYFPLLKINPAWLFRIFECKMPFVGLGKMGTQLNLNTETVGGIFVGLPPAEELSNIVEKLKEKLVRIEKTIIRSERSVELLKERRSALITAAVTGQIDLREGNQ